MKPRDKQERKAVRKRKIKPRVQRALDQREPKLVENPKTMLVLHFTKTSAVIKSVLSDIARLRAPHVQRLGKGNSFHPLDDATSMEFLGKKNDASLFAFGSHSKKRPHCLTLGRLFDHHALDIVEFLVSAHTPIASFKLGYRVDSFAALVFQGDAFEHVPNMAVVKNLLTDIFRPERMEQVPAPTPADRVLVFTAVHEDTILVRHYAVEDAELAPRVVSAEAQGRKRPLVAAMHRDVKLAEVGPRLDLKVSRTRLADADLRKEAMKQPTSPMAEPKREKNVTRSALLGKRGRVRMERQDLNKAAIKKMKALSGDKRGATKRQPSGDSSIPQ